MEKKPKKGDDPKLKKAKKVRFVPGTYDPNEMAGYMMESPEVTVSKQGAPWVKYMREYEKKNPMDKFVDQKKRAYLRLHPGLNKSAGVTMENFPVDVLQNFVDEYEYNKNSYVTKKYGKEAGFNPSRRGEWVDEINPTFKERFVADSKYGSKLQPSTWDRALAGFATLASPFSPDLQAELNAGTPGLTRRESREIKDANLAGIPIGGLEAFAPINTLGQNIANYAKNRGLSYGSDYKQLPGFFSGENMANVDDTDAMALDPIQMALAVSGAAELPMMIGKGASLINQGIKAAPEFIDAGLSSGLRGINKELDLRAGSRWKKDEPQGELFIFSTKPERMKQLSEIEELKKLMSFGSRNQSTAKREAVLQRFAERTSLPDDIFKDVTGYDITNFVDESNYSKAIREQAIRERALNTKRLPGQTDEEYAQSIIDGPPVDQARMQAYNDHIQGLNEQIAREQSGLDRTTQNIQTPQSREDQINAFMQMQRDSLIPEDMSSTQIERRLARSQNEDEIINQMQAARDYSNQLPPPPREIIIPDDIQNASNSLQARIDEIRAQNPNARPETFVRTNLYDVVSESPSDFDIDYAFTDYDNYDIPDYDPDFDPDFEAAGSYTGSGYEPYAKPKNIVERIKSSDTAKELKRLPDLYKKMFQEGTAKNANVKAKGALFASDYDSPKQMYSDLMDSINKSFERAKVGDIVTGSTNTSYNSYIPQMTYIFKNAGKKGLSQPIFLGYEPMNELGFLNRVDGVSNTEILEYMNNQLNKVQKKIGKDMNFNYHAPYIDYNDVIMVPQYGLKKTKDIKFDFKKLKYGGEIGKLKKFTD
jgi:hypothetical protein